MLTPGQWKRIKELFGEALELDANERQVFLSRECAGNDALRKEVQSLLDAHKESDGLSEHPSLEPLLDALDRIDSIDPYQLTRKLGQGGMGQVWLAEQKSPVRRQVAVKLLTPGSYNVASMQRFELERQSLAMMDHPAIAKVLDAGSAPDGRPFFVMEYVPGIPITDYCNNHRLTIRQRLELFIRVCEGVQHAHQKSIVHRDIKPSNILVTEIDGQPMPRIIDFGIAKPISMGVGDDHTIFTKVGVLIGTPGFMSPEQIDPNTSDIDTRTDVYSLGVLLYLLLTGTMPFQGRDWANKPIDEILREIREEEPPSPSTRVASSGEPTIDTAEARGTDAKQLVSDLRGDLDWITLKAMEKDRERRYASPANLAQDVRCHLENRPVLARPASAGYRLQKYVARHRILVATAAFIAALIFSFVALLAVQLRRTTRERDRANRITDFMTKMFEVADPSEARGNSVTVREILDKASNDIQTGLAADPEAQAQMLEVMGEVYDGLGLFSRSESLLTRAVDTRRRVLGVDHPETLMSMDNLAWVLLEEGHPAESEKLQREALQMRRRVLGSRDKHTLASMVNLASALNAQGRFGDAETLQREALDVLRQTRGLEDKETLTTMNNLGNTLSFEHKYKELEQLRRENLEIRRRVLGPEAPETLSSMINLGDILYQEGKYEDAEKLDRETLEIQRRVEGPEHPETLLSMYNLTLVLNKTGRYKEAEALGRTTLEVRRRLLGPEHPRTMLAMVSLAISLLEQKQYPEAEKLLTQAIETQKRILSPNHPDTAESVYELAVLNEREGKSDQALTLLREAVNHGLPSDDSLRMETDPEFKSLHGDPRFEAIVAAASKNAGDATRK